ncbi:MAG TPA: phage Gp37/Gp68 family protein [Lacunisphaera sp.]|nr:phage Gp37/Gp68 family protein [Lacunisphaera sp.]
MYDASKNAVSDKSKIEWTDATWNPVRGCTKVSPGCKHCYAETFAERFRGVPGHPYEFGFDLRLIPTKLSEPLLWSAPKTVFVNSMSDLFQDGVPEKYISAVAKVMGTANWHTYQVLTKRPERMRSLLSTTLRFAAELPHVWWGVSVENRRYGLPRIEELRRTPAAVRFLSVEPLLEDLGKLDLTGIHWVIVGGESGRGARSIEASWVRSVRDQCEDSGIPFFFKQWGGVRKSETGRELDGRTHDAMPPRSQRPLMDRAARIQQARRTDAQLTEFSDAPIIPAARVRARRMRAASGS